MRLLRFSKPEGLAALLEDIKAISAGATLANHAADRMEMEPKQPPHRTLVRRIYEPCTYYERFRALSNLKELLNAVEQLIGPNLMFH